MARDIEVYVANKLDDLFSVYELRREIFAKEQGFEEYCVFDGCDDVATNYILKYKGKTAGILRYKNKDTNSVIIDSFGVKKQFRKKGFATILLEKALGDIEAKYKDSIITDIVLSAQYYVKDFYAKHGFVEEGEVYDRIGIKHIDMRRKIKTKNKN